MKLRNKKTGEIKELPDGFFCGDNLKKVCDEWEDYEEPKEKGYFIDIRARKIEVVADVSLARCKRRSFQELGLYFNTREEAELAVRKLKAWKRLKDKGFSFVELRAPNYGSSKKIITIKAECDWSSKNIDDLDLLFGGEE